MTGETRIRVRYAETDQMGVVYHANYLVWFEVGRVELIRQMGQDYKSMEQEGFAIAVVEANVRYKSPARYDDELIVKTRIDHVRGSILRFAYGIYRATDDVLLCEGTTTHIVVDLSMKRTALPPHLAELFRAHHVAVNG
jgi:acyl-CoA thioester hydrolase